MSVNLTLGSPQEYIQLAQRFAEWNADKSVWEFKVPGGTAELVPGRVCITAYPGTEMQRKSRVSLDETTGIYFLADFDFGEIKGTPFSWGCRRTTDNRSTYLIAYRPDIYNNIMAVWAKEYGLLDGLADDIRTLQAGRLPTGGAADPDRLCQELNLGGVRTICSEGPTPLKFNPELMTNDIREALSSLPGCPKPIKIPKTSEAQRRAVANYDATKAILKCKTDPEFAEMVKKHAAENGESVSGMIRRLLVEEISR